MEFIINYVQNNCILIILLIVYCLVEKLLKNKSNTLFIKRSILIICIISVLFGGAMGLSENLFSFFGIVAGLTIIDLVRLKKSLLTP